MEKKRSMLWNAKAMCLLKTKHKDSFFIYWFCNFAKIHLLSSILRPWNFASIHFFGEKNLGGKTWNGLLYAAGHQQRKSQQEAVTLMLPWKGSASTCGVNGVQSRGSREEWTVRRTKDQARNVWAWVMSLTGAENGGMAQGHFRYPSNQSCLCS